MTNRKHSWWVIATSVWGLGVFCGLYSLWSYSHHPGATGPSPSQWPTDTSIHRGADRPVLLLFAHAKCPCTRASLRELERFLARHQGVESHIIMTHGQGDSDNWLESDLRRQAEQISGARLLLDVDNQETERFRARTSGLVLLYSPSGTLLFRGGITAARGHEGANDGTEALVAIVRDNATTIRQTPVFGCPLQSPDIAALQGGRS